MNIIIRSVMLNLGPVNKLKGPIKVLIVDDNIYNIIALKVN